MCQQRRQRNPHNDQKPRTEAAEIHHRAAGTFHEVVWVCAPAAYEVWEGGEHVGCYDEEGEVAVVEGGGEDDEEEAYC